MEVGRVVTNHERLFVKILYYDLWGGWKDIGEELQKRLALSLVNISWIALDNIDVECKELSNVVFEASHERFALPPKSPDWYAEPYLHILPVLCSEKSVYDSTVKEQITQWLADKTNVEWIVVYISLPKDPGRSATFMWNTFRSMKSDHNVKIKGKDRVMQLKIPDTKEKDDDEGWDYLTTSIKEAIIRHGQNSMSECIKEIRRLDSLRIQPSWDFTQFFQQKEGLAFLYETFHMYEEALMQYDELEALFSTVKSFEFCRCEEGDDSGNILSLNRKDFRKLIQAKTISEFDFKQYIFACQAKLLFFRSLPFIVAERALRFIRGMGKDMQKNNVNPIFIFQWSFGAYTFAAEECKEFALNNAPIFIPGQQISKEKRKRIRKDKHQLNHLLADLYLNASVMLHKLGNSFQFLPRIDEEFIFGPEPHKPKSVFEGERGETGSLPELSDSETVSESNSEAEESEIKAETRATRKEPVYRHHERDVVVGKKVAMANGETVTVSFRMLYQALQSPHAFDQLYRIIVRKAIRTFRMGHRQRSVTWLQYNLGEMLFNRGTPECYTECASLLNEVVTFNLTNDNNEMSQSAWPPLVFSAYNMLAECSRFSKQYEDYVDSLLHLLECKNLLPKASYLDYYYNELLKVIHDSELLPQKLAKEQLCSVLNVSLAVHSNETCEGPRQRHKKYPLDSSIEIECTLTNLLPNEMVIDSFCLQLVVKSEVNNSDDSDNENSEENIPLERRLILEQHSFTIKPSGVTKVILVLNPHQIGTFICNKMWIAMGNLLLTQSLPDNYRDRKFFINVAPSVSSLELKVDQPRAMLLKQPQLLHVTLNTCNDTLRKPVLEIVLANPPKPVLDSEGEVIEIPPALLHLGAHDATHKTGAQTIKLTRTTLPCVGTAATNQLGTANVSSSRESTSESTSTAPSIVEEIEVQAVVLGQELLTIHLPKSERNSILQFSVPILGLHDAPKIEQLLFQIKYEKSTGEDFFRREEVRLDYKNAFVVHSTLIKKDSPDAREKPEEYFLRVVFTNSSGIPVVIKNYKLNFGQESLPAMKAVNDSNLDIEIAPEQQFSFLFSLTLQELQSVPDVPLMEFSYQMQAATNQPSNSDLSLCNYSHVFSALRAPPSTLFELSLATPQSGVLATRMEFVWTITAVADQVPSPIRCHFVVDENVWLLACKLSSSLEFEQSDDGKKVVRTLRGTFIPLTPGHLPLPSLLLEGVQFNRLNFNFSKELRILVKPAPIVTSQCFKIKEKLSEHHSGLLQAASPMMLAIEPGKITGLAIKLEEISLSESMKDSNPPK